ncbi:MAG: translational machinery protein [Polyangiaceae bacterium]
MPIRHVAIWIDRKEAKIFHIEAESFDEKTIKAPHHHVTAKAEEQGHHAGFKRFFDDVAAALKDAEELLLVGPSSAKLDFIRYLHVHNEGLSRRIVGVETLDHPSDGQLVAYVKHYFHGKDRMLGLTP